MIYGLVPDDVPTSSRAQPANELSIRWAGVHRPEFGSVNCIAACREVTARYLPAQSSRFTVDSVEESLLDNDCEQSLPMRMSLAPNLSPRNRLYLN
jgi:hypothetical protein